MKFSRKPSIFVALLTFLVLLVALSPMGCREWERHKEWRFVRNTLLTSEYGSSLWKASRWTHSPKLAFSEQWSNNPEVTKKVISEINAVISGAGIVLDIDHDQPEILVFIDEQERFSEYYEKLDCGDPPSDLSGFTCVFDDENYRLKKSVVLISRHDEKEVVESLLFEEMYHALGVSNDSTIFKDSLFFEVHGKGSLTKKPSIRDKKLLRFLYLHLRPGDGEEEVRRAFDQHWDKITVQ